MKNWNISLALLATYLFTFHLWMNHPWRFVLVTGLSIGLILTFLLISANRSGYFRNDYDFFWHGVVVVDIVLEAVFIKEHDHYGFYYCALAFAAVVGGYRWKLLRAESKESPASESGE